jgi:FkbM family methyltransferase
VTTSKAFSLRPIPQTAGTCPRCDGPLQVRAIRVPGWRVLVDGTCSTCDHRFLQDLPSGHALVYPTTLDLTSGETFDRAGATWFSSHLRAGWERPDGGPVELEVRGSAATDSAVLANCLDPIYGHAVLKLLGVQRHLDAGDEPVIVLAPAALAPMIPREVAETWLVRAPVTRLFGWLLELEERLTNELARFRACRLAALPPHPHPSTFALERFVGHIEAEHAGHPSIVLSLRPDRRWGTDAEAEAANVAALAEGLGSAFPGAAITAVGAAPRGGLPADVVDLRMARPNEDDERRWIGLLKGADLAIGVHGSNLVLASGLAAATVELIPRERFGNFLQASLVVQSDPILALDRHRTLYGDDELSDVSAARVAEVVVGLLDGRDRVAALMTGSAAGVGDTDVPQLPTTPDRCVPEPPPTPAQRVRGILGRLPARARAGVAELATRQERPADYDGPVPTVMRDERGLAFELVTIDEVNEFRRHGGHFERRELDFLRRYACPGMTAFDVGANIGVFATLLARLVAPGGGVHAFEPFAASRKRLLRTLELNHMDEVVVNDVAVADTVGSALLADYGPGYESWSTLAPRTVALEHGQLQPARQTEVATTTLDHYCAAAGIERIDVLKVDVEGAEMRVLQGAEELLERGAIDLVLMEVADTTLGPAGSSALEVVERLEAARLRPHVIAEDGSLTPFRVAGPQLELANVVALSPSARRRLA